MPLPKPLKPLVTNKPLLDAVNAYINYRIDEVNKILQDAESDVEMRRSQGGARELKRMLNMREEVLAGDK